MAPVTSQCNSLPLFIDSDNALGSPRGDVDDGFALAALLSASEDIKGLGAVAGNTTADLAYRNIRALADQCGWRGPVLRAEEVPGFLTEISMPFRILALGPLTNVARALHRDSELRHRLCEIILVGTNSRSPGRWPPYFPFEYNLTADKEASQVVFASGIPLTIVPLNVARHLRMTMGCLDTLPGGLGDYLAVHSRRWIRRSQWLWLQSSVPVWDLVAAMYTLRPELYMTCQTRAVCHENAWVEFGAGAGEITRIESFDPTRVWRAFQGILQKRL